MESNTVYNSRKRPVVLSLFMFLVVNLVIAISYLFLVRGFNYTLQINGTPSYALSAEFILWMTFGMIILLGLVPYFLCNLANFNAHRHGLRLNYTLFYIHFLLFVIYTLFTYTLMLPVVGIIFLGLAIILGVFVVYRFTTNTIVGGSILSLWAIWLIYLFMLTLAYILII